MLTLRSLVLVAVFVAAVASDDGIGIDPNGGRPRLSGDHRCTIDPNGGTCTGAALDRGAGLDPNGQ